MSNAAHIALSVVVGGAAGGAAVLLYFCLVVRPTVQRRTRVSQQAENPPSAAFPFARDARGDLWESLGGGMWVCYGQRHADPTKPSAPIWLAWRDICCRYGPVTWLRPNEVRRSREERT
jgi:hypothetical protein